MEGASRAEDAMVGEPTPVAVSQQPRDLDILHVKKVDYVTFIAMVLTCTAEMASSSSFLSEDQFQCSNCLDVFTEPVTTCGHNFSKARFSGY